MEYFVLSNLSHNGRDYVRGDQIELPDDVAVGLVAAGVIQTEPVDAAPSVQEPAAPAQPAEPAQVGGAEQKTGEPSLDGSGERSGTDAATDITPKVDEKPIEPEAPKPGFMGRMFGGPAAEKTEPAAPAQPVAPAVPADPSADL